HSFRGRITSFLVGPVGRKKSSLWRHRLPSDAQFFPRQKPCPWARLGRLHGGRYAYRSRQIILRRASAKPRQRCPQQPGRPRCVLLIPPLAATDFARQHAGGLLATLILCTIAYVELTPFDWI